MSDPDVTITLGRSGRVVRRGATSRSLSGRKRTNGQSQPTGSFASNKRQRGNGIAWNSRVNVIDAPQVGKNDLRLKLIHKSLSKQIVGVSKGQRRKKLHENLSKSSQSWSGVSMLQQSHEPKRTSILRHMPPEEVIYDLQTGVSLRKPDSVHEMTGRWAGLGPTTMKTTSGTSGPHVQYASPSGMVQRSSHMGEQPLTVSSFLHSLGLDKYAILFRAEEVDMTVLKQMGDEDLKELGIPMGPRKKILIAMKACSKRHPP